MREQCCILVVIHEGPGEEFSFISDAELSIFPTVARPTILMSSVNQMQPFYPYMRTYLAFPTFDLEILVSLTLR